jgi:hypothetical protein
MTKLSSSLTPFQATRKATPNDNSRVQRKPECYMPHSDSAEKARVLYATLGYPSKKDFKWVIQSNQINNCPVTVQDVDAAHNIWGKNIAALKGKTT